MDRIEGGDGDVPREEVRPGPRTLTAPAVRRRRAEAGGGTDRVLLVLLALLNLGSAYTTLVGARQILPWPMSDVLGVTVQTMLFLTLAGFAARHAPIRRWVVIGVFAAASVYTSFFAYYDQLAGHSLGEAALDRARQAHARFVDDVWQPVQSEVDRRERAAAQLRDQAEREGRQGLTTGVVGFGPVARKLAEDARLEELAAAELRTEMERNRERFERPIEGLGAEEIYLADLEAWQRAPDAWKAAAVAPTREAYVDLEQAVALITPFWKVRKGELPAVAALILALAVDGISLLLGSAIQARRQPVLTAAGDRAVAWISEIKRTSARVAGAARRSGLDEEPAEVPRALDGVGVVLRVTGRGSDFLGAVYEAVHPETHGLDAARLLDHPDPTWRIAARVTLDRLRDPRVGWVRLEGGRWRVVRYDALTTWLADRYRDAVEAETQEVEAPSESVLQLPVPATA